jgi:hypothetical protein
MTRLFVVAVLLLVGGANAAVPCPNPSRSQAAVDAFKAAWSAAHGAPCPSTCRTYIRMGRAFVMYERCGACEVDHLCPIACCGADTPANMHWMDKKANRAKGADCTACPVTP